MRGEGGMEDRFQKRVSGDGVRVKRACFSYLSLRRAFRSQRHGAGIRKKVCLMSVARYKKERRTESLMGGRREVGESWGRDVEKEGCCRCQRIRVILKSSESFIECLLNGLSVRIYIRTCTI